MWRDYSDNQVKTHTHQYNDKEETLTNTGYEVMEDFFREEGALQSSEVELQHTSYGVHVVVVLVPCQRVLA